jgi:hypothetical protein
MAAISEATPTPQSTHCPEAGLGSRMPVHMKRYSFRQSLFKSLELLRLPETAALSARVQDADDVRHGDGGRPTSPPRRRGEARY